MIVRAWWLGPNTLAFGLTQTYSPLGLFTIRPDGSGVKALTHSDLDNFDPAWSPDGSSIAFTRSDGQRSTIWKMDASGANLRQLTPRKSGVRDSQPAWSPDGLRIVFARNIARQPRLSPDGDGRRRLTHDPARIRPGSRAALRTKLVGRRKADRLAAGHLRSRRIRIPANQRLGRRCLVADLLTRRNQARLHAVTWTLNGSYPRLIEKDLKTGTLKLLTTKPSPFGGVYSPDSTQLAFVSQPGGSGSFGVSVISVGVETRGRCSQPESTYGLTSSPNRLGHQTVCISSYRHLPTSPISSLSTPI